MAKMGQGPLNVGSAMKTPATGLKRVGALAARLGGKGARGAKGSAVGRSQRASALGRNAGKKQHK